MKARIHSSIYLVGLALVGAVCGIGHAEPLPALIQLPDVGTKATAQYRGDQLGVEATPDGAQLRCGFQKLEGRVTAEGLWLESTAPGSAGRFQIVAQSVGRKVEER